MVRYFFILVVVLLSCSEKKETKKSTGDIKPSKELLSETDTIVRTFKMIACPCANWITPEDKLIFDSLDFKGFDEAYHDSIYIMVEPIPGVEKVEGLNENMQALTYQFVGHYYKEKQYMNWEGDPGPYVTFQYESYKLIEE